MSFRPSEPRRAPLPNLGTLALALLLLSACSTTRNRGGYRGPSEHKGATIAAIDQARAELSAELGRPLKWDWKRNHVTLLPQPPTSHVRGIPQITHPHGQVGGYATSHSITLPHGFRRATLVHEAGHVVLFQNGINDMTGNDHHRLASRFFRKYTY